MSQFWLLKLMQNKYTLFDGLIYIWLRYFCSTALYYSLLLWLLRFSSVCSKSVKQGHNSLIRCHILRVLLTLYGEMMK